MIDDMNKVLESQIGGIGGDECKYVDTSNEPKSLGKAKYHGADAEKSIKEEARKRVEEAIDNARLSTPIRGGYIEMNVDELGDRAVFYPEGWKFYIKPATVDDIKNWSSIDEERIDQVNDVFNEIIRSCVKIVDRDGVTVGWNKLNSWDRFWFLLKVREYTFDKGEKAITYSETCPECDAAVTYELKASSLLYDLPDKDIIEKHWDREDRVWIINPKDYDVNGPIIKFYVPTLEKDAAIFTWLLKRQQEGKKINETFVKFLPWLLQKVSRDEKVTEKFIGDCEGVYKTWSADMFSLVDDIIRNIQIIPADRLKTICEHCGEEVSDPIKFPNGIRGLFTVSGGHKKFGSK